MGFNSAFKGLIEVSLDISSSFSN